MNKITEIVEYLTEAQIRYFGTVKDEKPQVRPIGFVMEFDGKAYFTTGEGGNIYNELQKNANFEVTAMHPEKPYHRIRFSGKAKFDAIEGAFEKFFELQPMMKDMPGVTLFSADEWEAIIYEGMQDRRTIKQ